MGLLEAQRRGQRGFVSRMCRANLQELDVSWCRGIPEEALGCLVDACPALTSLTLFGCSQARLHAHSVLVHLCLSSSHCRMDQQVICSALVCMKAYGRTARQLKKHTLIKVCLCATQVTGRFLHGHASEQLRVIGAQAQKAPAISTARAVLVV